MSKTHPNHPRKPPQNVNYTSIPPTESAQLRPLVDGALTPIVTSSFFSNSSSLLLFLVIVRHFNQLLGKWELLERPVDPGLSLHDLYLGSWLDFSGTSF
jgi:hypothetical protein